MSIHPHPQFHGSSTDTKIPETATEQREPPKTDAKTPEQRSPQQTPNDARVYKNYWNKPPELAPKRIPVGHGNAPQGHGGHQPKK